MVHTKSSGGSQKSTKLDKRPEGKPVGDASFSGKCSPVVADNTGSAGSVSIRGK